MFMDGYDKRLIKSKFFIIEAKIMRDLRIAEGIIFSDEIELFLRNVVHTLCYTNCGKPGIPNTTGYNEHILYAARTRQMTGHGFGRSGLGDLMHSLIKITSQILKYCQHP